MLAKSLGPTNDKTFRRDIAYRNLRVDPTTITPTMSNKTGKSINPGKNASKITSFFKPAQRATTSHDTSQRFPDHGGDTESLNLPMRPSGSLPNQNSPNSSFSDASIPSSSMPESQRVIPSSDGEDDSEDSDGLEDPMKMFRRKGSATNPAPAAKKKNVRSKSPVRVAATIPKTMAPPSYRFSLDNLVAEKAKSVALDQEILRSRALFEEANKEYTESNASTSDKPVSKGMLEDAFGEGTAKRLLAALNRKDAWRIDKSWHFYDMDKVHEKSRKNPFPEQGLREGRWDARLASVRNRQQMFLSGFVQDMTKVDSLLPERVYLWMLDELSLEIREDLAYAYFGVLCGLPRRTIAEIITESRVSRMFSLLGGRDDALDTGRQIVLAKAEMIDDQVGNFYNTKLVTVFFGKIARIISSNSTVVKTICVLLVRLALDVRIAREAEVRSSIEDSLAQLLENVPEERWLEISQDISLNLISTIPNAPYRLRVLNALPVDTPRTHLFRRRLALSYSFDDPSYLTQSYTNLVRISRFTDLLLKPQFKIDRNTDYSDLQSIISIMDIAIDDGPTTGDLWQNDAEVDVLVEDLRNMFSRIHDTNAQNLARTEAKDTFERLVFRLRFAVRVKEKMNLVVETNSGPEWVGEDGKVQSRLPWVGRGGSASEV